MKKLLSVLLVFMFVLGCFATAEGPGGEPPRDGAPMGERPEMPGGDMPGGQPPEMPEGGMPEMPGGERPEMPEGDMPMGDPGQGGPMGGMPGGGPGGQDQPESYDAVYTISEDQELTGAIESTGTDENAVLVTGGAVKITDTAIVRASEDSTGGDSASFYGVGAAVLVTGGEVEVTDSVIDTDANGGAGVFAYGEGTVYVRNVEIETNKGTSGGIHVAGGGTLYAENLNVLTHGESSAAIRSDRGGGTMEVTGGSYMTTGTGSPAVYVTADISVADAQLAASNSEALCLEGRNSVKLTNCELSGDMPDQEINDNTWTVILYQSMSGDAEVGEGRFEMRGGALKSENGGLFYTTNTDSVFVVSGVEISAAEDCEYFLRCTGNANRRGWGVSGSNGAKCSFTTISQEMPGDVIWDSISNLSLYVTAGSALTGAVIDDESCAGASGEGSCDLYIDATSIWTVTGDSTVTNLCCAGAIVDAAGNAVRIIGADGTVYVEGDSDCTVTVSTYSTECDPSGAGSLSA